MPIPQSNVIFFYLFAAFFVFITLRGELRKYMGFLLSTPAASSAQTTTSIVTSLAANASSNPAVIGALY
jgi:hypothetical protein